jgi:hypothetical protein
MRFAWLKKNAVGYNPVIQGPTHPLAVIRTAYNITFWVFLIPFLTKIDYGTGFIVFTVIVFVRLGANLYINFLNLKPEQYDRFPFRTP